MNTHEESSPGITFQAILNRVTTTVDGGWRVTFDLSQNEAKNILILSELRETLLQLAIIPISESY